MLERDAGPVATAGPAPVPGPWPAVACAALVAAAAYASLLGHWFYSDDFTLLRNNRELGLGGFLRFLLLADYGDVPWVYWRPGWALLVWLVHAVAGTVAWPYYLVCVLLHAALAGMVAALGVRAGGGRATGACAGVLFAVMPSHTGAVAWIAAAFNVVPAALCLVPAGWLCWRFAGAARARVGVALVALTAASLTFKEAAYAMPLVFAAACATARGGAWRGRLVVGAALAVLVVGHYLVLGRRTPFDAGADAGAFVAVFLHHAATYARGVLPFLPADDLVAVGATVACGALAWPFAAPVTRFLLLWTVAATLPYVVMTHGERFAYFCHAPAVLFATTFAAGLARRFGRSPHWSHALWLAVAAAAAARLPAALAEHRARGEECARIWRFVDEHGLQHEPDLVIDGLPLSLENGFEAMLELLGGRSPRVQHLQVVPRPPFLLYLDPAFETLPDATPVLRLGTVAVPQRATKAELVGDLVPLPLLSLVHEHVVGDAAAVQAALQRADRSLATRPWLDEPPPCTPAPPGAYRITDLAVDLAGSTCVVESEREALLLIAFPVPVELRPPGRVLVDGEPVRVLRANGILHAICLPAGRHRVTLIPAPVGS